MTFDELLATLRQEERNIGALEFKLRVVVALAAAGYDAHIQAFVLTLSADLREEASGAEGVKIGI